MSEDDTFRILSRPSYYEMQLIWIKSEEWANHSGFPEVEKLFQRHGWTIESYTNVSKDNYGKL